MYNNEGPDDFNNLGHNYTNGICSRNCDAKYQEPVQENGFYLISNVGNLEWYAAFVNKGNGNNAKSAKLTADIDFAGTGVTHTTIGQGDSNKYSGSFDGQGYSIKNMVINKPDNDRIGLFGVIRGSSAHISNIVIESTCSFTGKDYVGAIAGCGWRTDAPAAVISNCANFAAVTATNGVAGGIFGAGYDVKPVIGIENCLNAGTITANNAAAFCGSNDKAGSYVRNCLNIGTIVGNSSTGNLAHFSGSTMTLTNVYDYSDTESKPQGEQDNLSPGARTNGELCYVLNGDQSKIVWTQNLSGTVDAHPVLGTTSSRVYKNGTYLCPNTFVGEASYSNIPSSIPSTYTNGICSVDGCFEEPELDAEDGFYKLTNAGNIEWVSQQVATGHAVYAKMMNDIDFGGIENLHSPIGPNTVNKFNGVFDGQGHRITRLIINRPSGYDQAFVGFARGNSPGLTIRNLIMDKTCSFTGKDRVAAFVANGQLRGVEMVLENCVNEANVTATTGGSVAAFLATGTNENPKWIVRNCVNAGRIESKSENGHAAALVVLNSQNNVEVTNFVNVGEIVGYDASGNRIGSNTGTFANVIDAGPGATAANNYYNAASAASGELAYVANTAAGKNVFFQTIGTDAYPSPLNEGTVYRTYMSGANSAYSNTSGATVASMTLTDKEDYAADANFTATSLTYDRTLAKDGYHSLCLPFAVTTEMLGSGSKLFTLSAVGTDAVTLTETTSVAAGVPCFASVTSNFTFGEMTDVEMVASVNNSGTIKGTFTNQTIGAGFYKLSSDGTYFGLTTDGATATAFRSYIEAPTSGSVKTLNILLSDGTSLTPTLSEEREAVIYDLAGRRVEKATKGLYIINGKKVVK